MEIADSLSSKKLKFNLTRASELPGLPILCTTVYRNLYERATSVAHLTNLSFEFCMQFSHKIPLYFFHTIVQKSQNDQKLKSRGGVLP